ncbi:MAG: energy transducer TonB [Nitrospirales bacterium]
MTISKISQTQSHQLTTLTWLGSCLFHGVIILASLTFLTYVTPQPSSKVLKWKVSLVQPAPSPDPTEHVQTVTRPSPTHRQTLSRPHQHQQVVKRRPVQREQPSMTRTAASPEQKHTAITHQTISQKSPESVNPRPRVLPRHIVQASTRSSTTKKSMPLRQTAEAQVTPINTQPTIRTEHVETTDSLVKTGNVGKRSQPIKTATTQSFTTMTAKVTEVRTQNMPRHEPAVAQSVPTTVITRTKSLATTADVMPRTSIQKTEQTVTRSMNHQHSVSTQQPVKRMLKQSAIYAGTPNRQTVKKRVAHSKTTSISRTVMKSRPKEASDKKHVSNGLSKEVLAFLKLLREKIERHRQYPRVAKRLGYQGTTTVSFALSHAGDLTLLKVSEPSGHSILDEAALEAIQNVTPLKPPKTIGGTAIEIPVAFELSR